MLDCPVCGQRVDPASAPKSVHEGITYYLRCPHCKERFDADPDRYLRNGPDAGHGGCHAPDERGNAPMRLKPPDS